MPAKCLNWRYWIILKTETCKLGFICAFYVILHKCIIVTAQILDGICNSSPFHSTISYLIAPPLSVSVANKTALFIVRPTFQMVSLCIWLNNTQLQITEGSVGSRGVWTWGSYGSCAQHAQLHVWHTLCSNRYAQRKKSWRNIKQCTKGSRMHAWWTNTQQRGDRSFIRAMGFELQVL